MRALALALLVGATATLLPHCAAPPEDGALRCGPVPEHPCPDGYECLAGACWHAGHGPELGVDLR